MKRIIALVLIVAMALTLSGCGVPNGFTKNTYKITKEAISVLNNVADGKIGTAAAVIQLSDLYEALEPEIAALTDEDERSNAVNVLHSLGATIYIIDKANFQVSDKDMMRIRNTANSLEWLLKG